MSGSMSNGLTTNPAVTVGSGSDTIILQMSGDSFGPAGAPGADAQFTVNVDGQQIGGLQSVSASHAAGEDETFAFLGNFAPGQHAITVTFANNDGTQGDKTDIGRDGDRNVYVDGVSYDGQTVSSSTTPIYESPIFPPNGPITLGNAVFAVNDTTAIPADAPSTPTTTPGPIDFGSGADTLSLQLSEDPYQGDAQFTVSVDGKQVGGTFTCTAIAWQGQEQALNLHGDWGSGSHTVTVNYLSDHIGATDSEGNAYDITDQNLYVKSLSYDGVQGSGAPWELSSNGPHDFSVPAGGQPGGGAPPTSSTDTPTTGAPATDTSAKDTSTTDTSAAGTSSASTPSDTTPPAGTSSDSASSLPGDSSPTASDDTAPINTATMTSGSDTGSAGGANSGMSFIPSADSSGSAATTTGSAASDSASSDTTTTATASGDKDATQGGQDWTMPTPTSTTGSAGDQGGSANWLAALKDLSQNGGSGQWWAALKDLGQNSGDQSWASQGSSQYGGGHPWSFQGAGQCAALTAQHQTAV